MLVTRHLVKSFARKGRHCLALARSAIELGFSRGRLRRLALDHPVAITLTSYPARFSKLHLTIDSLLKQTFAPARVVLWIASDDFANLPERVKRMTARGLEIRTCSDLRSYKKLVPALSQLAEHILVIADDDTYYPANWLFSLLSHYDPNLRELPCLRAHEMLLDETGGIRPYREWQWDVAAGPSTALIVPTGVGGVVYPPGALHRDATSDDVFMEICPTADDLWFYYMARRVGYEFKKVGPKFRLFATPGTEESSLFRHNLTGNDLAIDALRQKYGDPRCPRK
jgi:hypothetical protein